MAPVEQTSSPAPEDRAPGDARREELGFLADEPGAGGSQVLFTTNPGLEDVVADELRERCAAAGIDDVTVELRPFEIAGHVLARVPRAFADLEPLALEMRSVHHVLRPLFGFTLDADDPLARIYDRLAAAEVPGMAEAASFRVTARRLGKHPFTSIDVQRAAGQALVDRYARPVDLEGYALNVRVDVLHQRCVVGLQLTGRALSQRYVRVYQPRVALKAPVAYALLRLARLELDERGALLDPFCGSGTILIEAAAVFPHLELHGCDLFPEVVEGARANCESLGLSGRIDLRQADARALEEVYPEGAFRAIVTNPPYGVRVGQRLNFPIFYHRFLEQAWRLLQPAGRLVLLVWKRGVFTHALGQFGHFRQRHVRVVETGDLYPCVFVLERPA